LPWARIDIGPFSLPHVERPFWAPREASVADEVTDASFWQDVLLPGLEEGLGRGWFAILLLAAIGLIVVAVAGRTPLQRALGVAGIFAAIAWVFTPASAGPGGSLFVSSLRYLSPALVIGLALVPLIPGVEGRVRHALAAGLGVLMLLTQTTPGVWEEGHRLFALSVGLIALAAGMIVAMRAHASRALRAAAAAALLAVVVGLGWREQREYLDGRYGPSTVFPPDLNALYLWARDLEDTRIAVAGVYGQYPLYGLDLSNHVQYVGREGPNGAYSRIRTCRTWRKAIADGNYRYVVTAPFGTPYFRGGEPAEAAWTGDAKGVARVFHRGRISVFRLRAPPDPAGCREAEQRAAKRSVTVTSRRG
jgi:hypothetical protein